MGCIKGCIKRLIKLFLLLVVFVAVIVLIPNLPPYTKFTSIQHEPTLARVGPLAPNDALNKVEKLYVDKLLGPEAFQLYKGEVYTSLATGEIVKLSPGGHVTFVTKIGQPCIRLTKEHICGRPLGFQIDERNNLMYVADAYYGIWKVDLKTDKKQLLVSPRVEIDGRKPMLFNFVALDQKGNLYWTDSTNDFHLKDGVFSTLSDPSGRLFRYDAAKNKSTVLLDNLWFANGIAVSTDDQFIVVAETCGYRLIKYYIDGPKKGKSEVFLAGLPGVPDNLRALPDGSGVLISLYSVFDDEHPFLLRSLSETPILRKFFARLLRLIEIPFEFLNQQFPYIIFEDIVYHIGHFKSLAALAPPASGLVHVDWNGKIIAAYYNTDGTQPHVSDAIVYNEKLYLGRPHQQNYISAVPVPPALKKAFSKTAQTNQQPNQKVSEPKIEKRQEPPQTAQKPVEAKPASKPVESKPTTQKPETKSTTQKPEIKPTTQKPETKPTTQKPEIKPTTQKPETKSTTQKPETKPTTPKKETKATTPKPETKATTPKPDTKSTTSKPETKSTTKPAETKATTSKPTETKSTPKPDSQPTTSKPPVTKPAAPKPEASQEKKQDKSKPVKSDPPQANNAIPEHIPIKEEIPVDTAKPNKETLKVIKKDGPAEIPNPHL